MLVLSRRINEKIVLPELNVTLQVVKLKGNQVRLAISAPESIRIMRGELVSDDDFEKTESAEPKLHASLVSTPLIPTVA